LWGESDLADLLDVCRELNRRMTVISRILQVSGNPIVVLENVTGSQGIRADEGAVWELPEDSKAYLLDMLSGGGVRLHIDYVELLYRALYDLAETPRSAFGDSGRNLSGTALEVEIQPLVQKVQRKRRVWDSVYRRRNRMLLDLLERFGGMDFGGVRRTGVIWGPILPSDREALVRSETALVHAGIHSRRTAMTLLGDAEPDAEWSRVLEEREALGEEGAALTP
ncbi:MAG: phage portal protein, partial [Actinobacteria bacterium]